MRILDRNIIKTVLSVFFGCILLFMFLYVIVDVFEHLDDILKQKTDLIMLRQYYLAYLPVIFVQITPIACLLAVLYTLGSLNRNNEIIAMRASGLSIWQITKTAIVFGIIVSIFVFLINEQIVPKSQGVIEKIKLQMQTKNNKKLIENDVIRNLSMYGLKNRLYFVNKFSLKDNTMEGITILEQDKYQNITKKIVANKGVWQDRLWTFYNSFSYEFDEAGQIKNDPIFYKEEVMSISETPKDFLSLVQLPEFMSISQLDDYIFRLSKSGADTVVRNLKVDLYQRLTFPLTSLVIIIVGIPFALKIKKRVTALASFAICFILGFLYYVSSALGVAFGKAGYLPPVVAVSLSHVLFFLYGIYVIYKLP
jgi:lipopolysaccharide export system permease protein